MSNNNIENDFKTGYTFDDVLLIPQRSRISSRKDTNLQSNLTKNIRLNIPIISANMDTVTESSMAIKIASLGGIGIIHRFMTIDEQISEVNRQPNAYGPTNLAFLVALNLADELLNLRGRLSRYEEVEEGLSRLCERLENVLSSPANSDQNGMALPDLSSRF